VGLQWGSYLFVTGGERIGSSWWLQNAELPNLARLGSGLAVSPKQDVVPWIQASAGEEG
jgi:hypothetical protein